MTYFVTVLHRRTQIESEIKLEHFESAYDVSRYVTTLMPECKIKRIFQLTEIF